MEKEIRALLDRLQVPSSMIGGISLRGEVATIVLEVQPTQIKAAEALGKEIEAQASQLPGISRAQVVITATREQPPAKAPSQPMTSAIKAIIAVASGKGGVGKSTVAVNLAVAASQLGLKVGLLDADIYGPSLPTLLNIHSKQPPLDENKNMIPPEVAGLKVMSIGFLMDASQALVWRGPMVHSAINQMLRNVAWGDLDILFVDMPPGTGDAQLSLAQNAHLAGAVIVSTPQDLALADARRGVEMFKKVNVPILGLIENMSSYQCPNCGHEAHIFGHGGAKAEAEKLGVPFLGELPLELAVREASDMGTPIVLAKPEGTHAKVFSQIARAVWERVSGRVAA